MEEDLEDIDTLDKIKGFLSKNRFIIFIIGFFVFVAITSSLIFYYLTVYQHSQPQKTETSSLQKKCDIQAPIIFNSIQQSSNSIDYTYKKHFINSLGRCYILVHGVALGQLGLSDDLIDVFSNKTIADCESYTTAPDINYCTYGDNASIRVKYNIDQFNEFVKPYMETE